MAHARLVTQGGTHLVVATLLALPASTMTVATSPSVRSLDAAPLAAVAWPPSTSLIVAEIVTGGVSASDEYVELANAGSSTVDLAGIEVAYVTASGSTVTRKATWSISTLLEPGRHLLI